MNRRRDPWTALSLGVAILLAVLDVALSAVVIAGLGAAPLLAAARSGMRGTALIAVFSLTLAVALGVPDGIFGQAAHLVRCAVVAGAGLLAIWVAGLSERLATSNEQLRAILEGVADGVVARDATGRPVFANRAALELLGFAEEADLLSSAGEPVTNRLDVFTEDGRRLDAGDLPGRRAARGEQPPPVTVRLRPKDGGDERWAVIKSTAIHDDGGRPTMAISIVEDLTEAKLDERRHRLLAEAGQLLASSLDWEATLRSVAELAVPDVADWCAVDVVDPAGRIRSVGLAAADPDKLALARELRERYPPDPTGAHGAAGVLRTGEAALYPKLDGVLEEVARDADHLALLRRLGMHSAMVVPMAARGRTLGSLTLVSAESARTFAEDDLLLAQDLAGRMGTALDNARLYRDRSRIARALQDSLLPPALPEVAGLDVAARFRAAGEGNEVGGDFYDLFDTGGSRWAVVIGDVCGKGADAAAVTALARYTLRTAAMRERWPSQVLATLNEAMLRQRNDEQFCTVAFGVVQPTGEGAQVVLASGGHPLPLLLRADGRVDPVGHPGTLLGVVKDPRLGDEAVDLQPGDALVFYTDGVTEAQAPERIISAGELAGALAECHGCDAATLAERLERHAVPSDREPRDDVAILVLRVRETP